MEAEARDIGAQVRALEVQGTEAQVPAEKVQEVEFIAADRLARRHRQDHTDGIHIEEDIIIRRRTIMLPVEDRIHSSHFCL